MVSLYIFSLKSEDLFWYRHYVHPFRLPSDRLFTVFFLNAAAKNFDFHQGVTPWMVSLGAVRSPTSSPVTPLH